MAQDTQLQDLWPIAQFHFSVTIDGETISFQEVSGLDQEADVIDYRHGDSPDFFTIKRQGIVKTSRLVLKKGIFDGDSRLLDIFNKVYDKEFISDADGRMEILIELLDETGEPVMTWNVIKAIPVKIGGTTFNSTGNQVAIEQLEFAYERVELALA
ncbi:MAG: phage tail protein [Bacteroidia bacterium]|nr:phage tail protein [Bacteroidia bacterium]